VLFEKKLPEANGNKEYCINPISPFFHILNARGFVSFLSEQIIMHGGTHISLLFRVYPDIAFCKLDGELAEFHFSSWKRLIRNCC